MFGDLKDVFWLFGYLCKYIFFFRMWVSELSFGIILEKELGKYRFFEIVMMFLVYF